MPRINVSRVLRNPRFLTTVTIESPSEVGEWQDGIWHDSEPVYTTLSASVQPASAQQVRNLPEGMRTSEAIVLYTTTPIKATDPANRIQGDFIRNYRGQDWKVESSEYWDDWGTHYAVAVRCRKRQAIT